MNIFFLLKSYLKKEKHYINFEELKLQLLSHPSYPSLHSITGVLDHFGLENMALEVSRNLETLKQLPKNFISLTSENSQFVMVTQTDNTIQLTYNNKKKKYLSINEFLEIWKGIIVVVESNKVQLKDKNIDFKKVSTVFYSITIILIIILFYFAKPLQFESVHFVASLIGLGISLLIVNHELGYQSSSISKFCSVAETTSCDAVLNSKGATISRHFKLSDLSFVYFAGIILAWLLTITYSANNFAILIATLFSFPITLYSIYYQYKIVKKWCPLCLGIVAVLWLQCFTSVIAKSTFKSIEFDIASSFILFFSFLIITALWTIIKPLLKKKQLLKKLEIKYNRFKRNFDLFHAAYSKGKQYNTDIGSSNNNEITMGNKNARVKLLVVTNPSCFYCRSTHTDLEKILKNKSDDVAITIRFNLPKDENNDARKVALRTIEIYNTESESKCLVALHEAYKKEVDLAKWLLKWGESKGNKFENILKDTKEWCITNTINFTPALFINGKEFPKIYDRSDLHYFIDDLVEQAKANTNKPENIEIAI